LLADRERQLNGLRAFVGSPHGIYTVNLPDEKVSIDISFTDDADRPIIEKIVETIAPVGAAATVTTGPAEYCSAVADANASASRVSDPSTGQFSLDALPSLERVRDAAPTDVRDQIDVVIDWARQGSPLPKPADVAQAQLLLGQDMLRRCPPR
jgi:hypothetical protein